MTDADITVTDLERKALAHLLAGHSGLYGYLFFAAWTLERKGWIRSNPVWSNASVSLTQRGRDACRQFGITPTESKTP